MVENKDNYKENTIIDQNPTYDPNKEPVILEKGDTIILYVPDIFNEYPDMVDAGWTLNDVIAFSKEYKLKLSVYDSNDNLIPESEYTNLSDTKVFYQQRPVGDEIIEGISFYVKLNIQYNAIPEIPNTPEIPKE